MPETKKTKLDNSYFKKFSYNEFNINSYKTEALN